MIYVFAFDRDLTVDCAEHPGPVPLDWIKRLATETSHEVWAIGNQKLKEEAGIPGLDELRLKLGMRKDKSSVVKEMNATLDSRTRNVNGKHKRLRLLHRAFPTADRFFAVDDFQEVGLIGEPWEFFLPDQFVDFWYSKNCPVLF